MHYIKALDLVNKCVELGIMKEVNNKILVFTANSGWNFVEKDIVVKDLMSSEEGQYIITEQIKEKMNENKYR